MQADSVTTSPANDSPIYDCSARLYAVEVLDLTSRRTGGENVHLG